MVYVVGDTHGELEIYKINNRNFPEQKKMTKKDYLIVLGDFGLVWNKSKMQEMMLENLSKRNFTTLGIDGNHENFDLLKEYPVTLWNGGYVQKITDSVIHLMRGQVFTIEGKKIFVFGGAESIDKEYRIPGVSWWPQEIPSFKEMETGYKSLEEHDNKVDYILTHTCSKSAFEYIAIKEKFKNNGNDPTIDYLESIKENTEFKHWYFGHFHIDLSISEKETAVYEKIIRII